MMGFWAAADSNNAPVTTIAEIAKKNLFFMFSPLQFYRTSYDGLRRVLSFDHNVHHSHLYRRERMTEMIIAAQIFFALHLHHHSPFFRDRWIVSASTSHRAIKIIEAASG